MTNFKLNEREKNRIKAAFDSGNLEKIFTVIETIFEENIDKRIKMHIVIDKTIQTELTGGEQKRYWADIESRAYEVFLTLPEEVKQGRHLAEFKQAVRDKVSMGESAYKKKYEAFVKRYKEENTPEAQHLKELQKKAIELAYEIEPPLG
jgi:hypothetical protein